MKGAHKHMGASLKPFHIHRCLSQSEESKCMWTHGKDGTTSLHCTFSVILFAIFSLPIGSPCLSLFPSPCELQ